jgi:DDE superfamily endonuclease
MLDWIERVWVPFAVKDGSKVLYLLLDSCTTHMTAAVREAFSRCNTEIDFIPPGYTSKLQMMDVGVNKPFKDRIRTEFDDWLVTHIGDDDYANPKPKRENVAQWIVDSWNDIGNSTIMNSWQRSMGNLNDPRYNEWEDNNGDDHDFLDLVD